MTRMSWFRHQSHRFHLQFQFGLPRQYLLRQRLLSQSIPTMMQDTTIDHKLRLMLPRHRLLH